MRVIVTCPNCKELVSHTFINELQVAPNERYRSAAVTWLEKCDCGTVLQFGFQATCWTALIKYPDPELAGEPD